MMRVVTFEAFDQVYQDCVEEVFSFWSSKGNVAREFTFHLHFTK